MDSFTNELDQQLRHYMKTKRYAFDALEVWNLSSTLGLKETQEAAARLVTVAWHDFREPHGLSELAREHPEASALIQLVGAQGVRAKALADVLFAFHRPSMLLRRPMHQGYGRPPILDPVLLMCSACTEKHSSASYIVPAWMVWWAHTAYTFLLSNPLEASGHLFEPAIMWNHEGCRPCCISALMCESTYRSYFIAWASGVKAELASSLQEAESVYFT
ncbi:hypothetical protein BDV93DRAFT_552874 [Ceratobasidium sp. AG-I]|nr:hypothetical protein BDV93DRAFT_552874 [Ceratobasidium sp. AG-I]